MNDKQPMLYDDLAAINQALKALYDNLSASEDKETAFTNLVNGILLLKEFDNTINKWDIHLFHESQS